LDTTTKKTFVALSGATYFQNSKVISHFQFTPEQLCTHIGECMHFGKHC